MRLRIRNGLLLMAALGMTAVFTGGASAAQVAAGVLKCDVASGWGLVFGSTKDLKCVFSPVGKGAAQNYTGEIRKYGVDIGYTKSGILIWTVLAPRTNLAPGTLEGQYLGATAEASAGAGAGANVLIGGGNSISLQPLSISGQEGLNVAGGIGAVILRAVRK